MEGHHSVLIEFTVLISRAAFVAHCESVVPTMLAVPGLESKVWLLSEDGRRGGGVYLFQDARSAQAYVDGPVVAALRASPALCDVTVKVSPIVEALTRTTKGIAACACATDTWEAP